MTEPHEISAAKDIGVGARIARRAMWIGAGLVSFIVIAGLWAPDVRAQIATTDQGAPKLTSEMCLGCHGLEGFAPAPTPISLAALISCGSVMIFLAGQAVRRRIHQT